MTKKDIEGVLPHGAGGRLLAYPGYPLPAELRKNPNRSSTPSRDRKEMAEVVFCLIAEPDILDPPHRQHHERIQSFNKLVECRLYLFAIANDFVHHLGRDRTFCRPLSRRQY